MNVAFIASQIEKVERQPKSRKVALRLATPSTSEVEFAWQAGEQSYELYVPYRNPGVRDHKVVLDFQRVTQTAGRTTRRIMRVPLVEEVVAEGAGLDSAES